jgi:hypothetical protein
VEQCGSTYSLLPRGKPVGSGSLTRARPDGRVHVMKGTAVHHEWLELLAGKGLGVGLGGFGGLDVGCGLWDGRPGGQGQDQTIGLVRDVEDG